GRRPSRHRCHEVRHERRGVRNRMNPPRLDVETILAWADAYHARTGRWPKAKSGPIPEAPGETWMRVSTATVEGLRGLGRGPTLAQLLAERRGAGNHLGQPRLTVGQVMAWAADHERRTGKCPTSRSGPVEGASGEDWGRIDNALLNGLRGLPPGLSLARLRR